MGIIKSILRSGLAGLDRVWPKESQEWMWKYLYHRSRGSGNGNPATNGEYRLIEKCLQSVKGEFIAFDVGANVGDWSLFVGQKTPKAKIYAFEPSPYTSSKLKERIGQAMLSDRVHVENVALGGQSGRAQLYEVGKASGSNSLHRREGIKWDVQEQHQITIKTGDEMFRGLEVPNIHFVKIDVEGHETEVLMGFQETLKNQRIGVIQFEYGGSWIDSKTSLKEVFSYLRGHGYSLGKVFPGEVRLLPEYTQDLEDYVYANYIAFPRHKKADEFVFL